MGQLPRACKSLLRTVANRTHATRDDHAEEEGDSSGAADPAADDGGTILDRRVLRRPTRPHGQQQVTPPSSETARARRMLKPAAGTQPSLFTEKGAEVDGGNPENGLDDMRDPDSDSDLVSDLDCTAAAAHGRTGRTFKMPTQQADSGRNGEADGRHIGQGGQSGHDSDSDPFPWGTPRKRARATGVVGYGSKSHNIHALPEKKTYSRKKGLASSQESRKGGLASSQEAKKRKSPAKEADSLDQPERKFQSARSYDPRIVDQRGDAPARGFKAARGVGADRDELDSHSPLSSPPSLSDLEDLAPMPLTAPDGDPVLRCAICSQEVDVLRKQAFEDKYTRGRPMTYKWQQRFCKDHRQHDARRLWDERGYPQIDWDRLDDRLRDHHQHLRAILDGSQSSSHRDDLQDRVRRRARTAAQSIAADAAGATSAGAERRTSAGYYGPRGEKAMTEHILQHLSGDIRAQAAKDKLVAASGVSGGVSGFVHLVLVPELAEQLLRQDLKIDAARSRAVLDESAEFGELLNPERDETIEQDEAGTP